MMSTTRQVRVFACAEPVSMRKGFDGLLAVARQSIGREPLEGDLYLFVARNRKQARVLYWDGSSRATFLALIRRSARPCPPRRPSPRR